MSPDDVRHALTPTLPGAGSGRSTSFAHAQLVRRGPGTSVGILRLGYSRSYSHRSGVGSCGWVPRSALIPLKTTLQCIAGVAQLAATP